MLFCETSVNFEITSFLYRSAQQSDADGVQLDSSDDEHDER